MCSIYIGGHNIEAYVEGFLLYCLNLHDDDPGWTLGKYIDSFTLLLLCGSEFTVGDVEEEANPKKFGEGKIGLGLQWPWSLADQDCHHAKH